MKRTIHIGDKHKSVIEEYEMIYDKEEFNMLITKLLLANKTLRDKNIDILVVADLIDRYNIDFFALMNSISSCRDSRQVNFVNPNEVENSPIVTTTKEKPIVKEKTKAKKIEEIPKDIKILEEKKIDEVPVVEETENDGFNNNLFSKKETDERITKPNTNVNPILNLNIDLR